MYSEKSMYPMMGVGVFNIMFWTGFVVAHNIGLTCDLMLLTAFLFGATGSYGVVRLERLSKGGGRPRRAAVPPAERTHPEPPVQPVLQS